MIPSNCSCLRASGSWVGFEGRLYPAVRLDAGYSIRWFGDDPPGEGWRRHEWSHQSAERLTEWKRVVSSKVVSRYVRLQTEATWGGRRFDVMGFKADGQAILFACVSREEALALIAGKHSWEMVDPGFVSGVVPVSELIDVVETFKDYSLLRV